MMRQRTKIHLEKLEKKVDELPWTKTHIKELEIESVVVAPVVDSGAV